MSISGREGVGKTSFSLWCCNQWLNQGKRIMYFTNEQTQEELLKILAANKLRLDSIAIRNKKVSEADWKRCVQYWRDFPSDKFLILDQKQGVHATSIQAHYLQHKPDIIVVDNLNQINSEDPREPRPLVIKKFVEDVHSIVKNKKHEVGAVLLSHLNAEYKKNRDGRPDINNIAESAALRREAHTSLLLHWGWYDQHGLSDEEKHKLMEDNKLFPENLYLVIVAKARNGKPGVSKLNVDMKFGSFSEWIEGVQPSEQVKEQPESWDNP
jgi:replicative DNA helicase